MKQTAKKVLALSLATLSLSLTGCGLGQQVEQKLDETMTQLRISVYDSGFGTHWLENYAKEFENKYKDYSVESGKKGVQIRLDKNQINDEVMLAQVPISENALYFNNVDYYALATSGVAEDLSSYMKQPLTEFNDAGTIEDKLDDTQKEYMLHYDNKYYAIPSYEMYRGVTYDMDLFEEARYGGFYMTENGGWTRGVEGTEAKSKGPDNKANTYDDGLPVTFDDFFKLMDRMVEKGVIPFVWTGQYRYADMLMKALFENFEGNDLKLHYTFDGTANNLIDVADDGTVTKLGPTAITWQNGYDLKKSEGYYRALQFAEKLVDNPSYYYVESFSGSLSHTGAQERYLSSRFDKNSKPIAMIVEGTYWQCEAIQTFNSINTEYSEDDEYSFEKRRYGFMPMPHYNLERAAKNNYAQTIATEMFSVFMKKGLDAGMKEAAAKFLQFTSSNDMVKQFLIDTHYARGLNATLTAEEIEELPAYAKSNYNVKANYNIVYEFSTKPFWLKYESTLLSKDKFGATTLGASISHPIYNFHDDKDNKLTPINYFKALHDTAKADWKNYSL